MLLCTGILGSDVFVEVARTGSYLKQFCLFVRTAFPYLSGIVLKLKKEERSSGYIEEKVLLTLTVVHCASGLFAMCCTN